MEIGQTSASTLATTAAIKQAQGSVDMHLEAIKNQAQNEQVIAELLQELTDKGQQIDIKA